VIDGDRPPIPSTRSRVAPAVESVWDYPRPPRVEPCARRVRVVLGGVTIVDSIAALRVLETSHPPGIYVPPADVTVGALRPVSRRTVCEFKGTAAYFDVAGGDRVAPAAAWAYRDPRPGVEALRDHLSFYPGPMDRCLLDEEPVTAQAGDFYGGWITADVQGPFKGGRGTLGW
jgi:uncharacterized protein (DUF427 family)